MKRVIYETLTEALSDEDKRAVLDIEADIVDLKQQLIDADDVEKEDINQRIADLKDEMNAIKQASENE